MNNATLSNTVTLTGINETQYWDIRQALTFKNLKHAEALKFGRSTWKIDPYIKLFDDVQSGIGVPRGFPFKNYGDFTITDDRHTHPVQIETTIDLRDYQQSTVSQAIEQGGGVIVAPTGSGKTIMAIELAARLGQRCLILVKSQDLAKQWIAAIKQTTGLACGLIGSGKWIEGNEFTVALIQTLVKHSEALDYGLVI